MAANEFAAYGRHEDCSNYTMSDFISRNKVVMAKLGADPTPKKKGGKKNGKGKPPLR